MGELIAPLNATSSLTSSAFRSQQRCQLRLSWPTPFHRPLSEMATVDDLAYELLSAIFSEFLLPFDFDDIAASREARRTLVSASLVSTRWRDPAQRALFERPLFTDRAKSPVSQWLRGEARKRYLVTRIDFASARYGFESDEVDKVLRSTERLEEVRFGMIVNGEPWKLLTLPAVAGELVPPPAENPDDTAGR